MITLPHRANIYRKTGTIIGVDSPVEAYGTTPVLRDVECYLEPMSVFSPLLADRLRATHRWHTNYRTDMFVDDQIVMVDNGTESNEKFVVKHILQFRGHHTEIWVGPETQPNVSTVA